MHTRTSTRDIPFDANQTWAVLDDFANTWVYHPIVKNSSSVNGIRRGLGARRQCTMYSGDQIQEEVIQHNAADRSCLIKVVEHGPFPTKEMEVKIKVQPTGAHACRVTYVLSFQPKYGPLGWVMAKAALGPGMDKMLKSLLQGLEDHLRTGRVVQEKGELGDKPALTAKAA